jgi:hypothetical protein
MSRYDSYAGVYWAFNVTRVHLYTRLSFFHGGNMGSNPLGRANKIRHFLSSALGGSKMGPISQKCKALG